MLLDNFLPVELTDKIYKIRHSLQLKDIHNELEQTKIIVEGKLFILKKNYKQKYKLTNPRGFPYYYRRNNSLLYLLHYT